MNIPPVELMLILEELKRANELAERTNTLLEELIRRTHGQ